MAGHQCQYLLKLEEELQTKLVLGAHQIFQVMTAPLDDWLHRGYDLRVDSYSWREFWLSCGCCRRYLASFRFEACLRYRPYSLFSGIARRL